MEFRWNSGGIRVEFFSDSLLPILERDPESHPSASSSQQLRAAPASCCEQLPAASCWELPATVFWSSQHRYDHSVTAYLLRANTRPWLTPPRLYFLLKCFLKPKNSLDVAKSPPFYKISADFETSVQNLNRRRRFSKKYRWGGLSQGRVVMWST